MTLPRAAGTYALVLRLDNETQIEVGRLGRQRFPPGYYVYAGSALGGLAARLARHLRLDKPRHWHVDYLRPHTRVLAAYALVGAERFECALARALAALPDAREPIAGFGASDCRCPSHLVWLPEPPTLTGLLPGLAPYRHDN
ncbi:MAG: GIY-YIG nuclease family protein [Chloroflexota bacterium]